MVPESAKPKKPPFSEDAEQAVLSAILQDNSALIKAAEIVNVESFYLPRHQRLFDAMLTLGECGMKQDPLTVADLLGQRNQLDATGGKDYLGYLMDVVPTSANVEYHAAIVRRFANTRSMIGALASAIELAHYSEGGPEAIAQQVVNDLLPLAAPLGKQGFVRMRDDLWNVMESIEARAHRPDELQGVATGFSTIDDQTGGWRGGELTVICGVPKAGKSAVALCCALYNAVEQQIAVGYVSPEMRRPLLIERAIANISGVDGRRIRTGKLQDGDFPRLAKAAGILSAAPLYIDDTPCPTLSEIVVRCKALKIRYPEIRALYVDYLQLIEHDEETRAEELRKVSYGLAGLAKSLDVPVIALAQLNDKVIEQRADKKPTLADIQGSSGVRQAADFIGLIYRESMYKDSVSDIIELDFPATRGVGVFTARLVADMKCMRLTATTVAPRYGNSQP